MKNDGEHQHGKEELPHIPEPARVPVEERVRDYEEGRVPAPAIINRGWPFKVLWRHVSWRQVFRDSFQFITGLMVVILFFVWIVFGSTTISKQNQEIIKGVREDLVAHAEGSQMRQCAIASELEFFFAHPAHVKGQPDVEFVRPKWQLKELQRLKAQACHIVPLP